jgi:hypothetical protein
VELIQRVCREGVGIGRAPVWPDTGIRATVRMAQLDENAAPIIPACGADVVW